MAFRGASTLARQLPKSVNVGGTTLTRRWKAYSIARIDVHNEEDYKKYAVIASKAVADFGGNFLVRGGEFTVLEGEARARNVVIEWPDSKTAHEFYTSPDYSEALSYGIPAATRDYIIVEGP
eukprot:CAMPEP_0182528180 /NCGR_PEP_ID=MMETSP1323-20130603/4347_1 /TAXON_ID=236787 /ORGANISM="Florenciella parvula, Strain RCC1693" /LENGTH=121 /DNA_ID=CAMNT_0024737269 /DNA_START=29 /DNA_END=394 /DNA_ORIENTATION=+